MVKAAWFYAHHKWRGYEGGWPPLMAPPGAAPCTPFFLRGTPSGGNQHIYIDFSVFLEYFYMFLSLECLLNDLIS